MHLSIVIPTFNRAHLYPQTLPALRNQVCGDFTYEVVFVANGSTDDTDIVLKRLVAEEPEKFRYFWIEPTGGPSAPRNAGIRAATGEVVIIIDDDVIPHPDLVLQHAEFHQRHPEPHEAALGQVYVPEHLMDDPMSLYHTQYSFDQFRDRSKLTFMDFWTCNISFKRQFMLDHGMFDERIPIMEDIEVGFRLHQAGMHLYFQPSAQGQHIHQTNPAKVTERARVIGEWLYRITKCIPGTTVQKRFGLISLNLGVLWSIERLIRLMFWVLLDNPLTRTVLRLLGATRNKRNRITDAYYGLIFKRAFLMGYYNAWFSEWRAPTEHHL